MTENSSGENNIESLAQRAKDVLDRVRANTDDLTTQRHTSSSVPEDSSWADLGTDIEPDDTDIEPDDIDEIDVVAPVEPDDIEPDETDIDVDEIEPDETDIDVDDIEPDETDVDVIAAAVAVGATEHGERAEVEEPTDAEAPVETDDVEPSSGTDPVAVGDIRAEAAPVEDDDDRRAIGWLIPAILGAVVVLAVIAFGGGLFDSSDDEDTSSAGSGDSSTSTDGAPDTTAATTTEADTTSTESTSSTTTTTTEAPPVMPATAWDLLGEASSTNEFAAFAGPLGLQALLESAPTGDASGGFTLLAPSNDALAALSQEQTAALSLDPAAAQALVDYHVVDGRLTQDLLLEAAGGQIESRVGLPITVTLDGDRLLLNDTVSISTTTLEALNGNVIVIDSVLEPPTINSVINLGDVQFEVISAIITPEGRAELQKAVTFFAENPEANAVIQGHTDTDGPAEPNQRLSERRARAVRDYLISQGIDGGRLEAEGFGESQPILVDGVEDKAASRRIEFLLR